MKLIQALKTIKVLQKKIDDIKKKIGDHCADMDTETPVYGTPEAQREQITSWLQSCHDSVKEILRLRVAIQRTNLATLVVIPVGPGGETQEKSIAAWIHRRRDLAGIELSLWDVLGDRGLKPQGYTPTGNPDDAKMAKVRRYFSPQQRDAKQQEFTQEPHIIDGCLEVANATTDLIEER